MPPREPTGMPPARVGALAKVLGNLIRSRVKRLADARRSSVPSGGREVERDIEDIERAVRYLGALAVEHADPDAGGVALCGGEIEAAATPPGGAATPPPPKPAPTRLPLGEDGRCPGCETRAVCAAVHVSGRRGIAGSTGCIRALRQACIDGQGSLAAVASLMRMTECQVVTLCRRALEAGVVLPLGNGSLARAVHYRSERASRPR